MKFKEENQEEKKKRNFKSLLITSLVFLGLAVIFYFVKFWPPKDYKELLIAQGGGGGSVAVNFGNTDFGKGAIQEETIDVKLKEVSNEDAEPQEDLLTQDEVGADVPTPAKSKIKPKVKPKNPSETTVTKPTEKPVKKRNAALDMLTKGAKSGDGNTNTEGNQGKPYGKGKYYKGGKGDGKGDGNGKGDGKGDGDGPGTGGGSGGASGSKAKGGLSGRRLLYNPTADNSCNSYGTVVIEITVDQSGRTIKAENGRGTKAEACLIKIARQYALQTKWSANENAAEKQTGTITYIFSN